MANALYTPTSADLAQIPDVLKTRTQWILWKAEDRLDKTTGAVTGLNKIPYTIADPDVNASSADPLTWGTFADAVAAWETALEGWEHDDPAGYRGGGLGYVLTAADPYTGVDLDHSVDPATGAMAPWAQAIVDQLGSYTQRSCSGTGLHVLIAAALPPGRCQDGDLQMWDHARYFAMTGWHVSGTPATIEARQGPLEALWCDHFGAQVGDLVHCVDGHGVITNAVPWAILHIDLASDGTPYAQFAESTSGWPLARCELVPPPIAIATGQPLSPPMPDDVLLQKANAAKNGAKFGQLWAGDWTGYTSQSEGDLALCQLLAFWTQDPGQIQRLFEDSGLYRAAKWGKRANYRQQTIRLALAQCSNFYQPAPAATTPSGTFGTFGTSSHWAFPEKLPSGFPDVPALPDSLLPAPLRAWCVDMADRQQVPLEFVAVPAVLALATVVGRKVAIRPKQRDDWLVVPNLWGAIVGRPGVLKTPALKAAVAPLDRLIATAAERYKGELLRGHAELAAHEAQVKALKHAMEAAAKKPSAGSRTLAELTQELMTLESNAPVLLCERRYRTSDSTVEKLGELFQENPTGLLLFRDELSGWLRNLERQGREGDREFFLEAWNGDGAFTVDRIGRGTKHIPALCLSVCGGIQPGKLTAYIEDAVSGGYGDDGLMQRFQLLVWPDIPTTWTNVDRYPDTSAKNAAYRIYERLDEVAPAWLGAQQDEADTLPYLSFAPDAQDLFDAWRSELEATLRDGSLDSPVLESHLAKYRSLMPSLALLFHLVDVAHHQAPQPQVSIEAAILAAAWCDFLRPHAERVYAGVLDGDLHAAHALAEHIRCGDVRDGDQVRSVYRRHWSTLDTPERIGDALAILERHAWLRVEERPTNGRPSDVLIFNPDLSQIL